MKKSLGNKRNKIGDKDEGEADHIGDITRLFGAFRDGEVRAFPEEDPVTKQSVRRERVVSRVFDNTDFGYRKVTVERPLQLNYRVSLERLARLEEQPGFRNLATSARKAEKARLEEIEAGRRQEGIRALLRALAKLSGSKEYVSRTALLTDLREADRKSGLRLTAAETKVVLAALGERDDTAEVCRDRGGSPEPDPELRDAENVPLKEDVAVYLAREVLEDAPLAVEQGGSGGGLILPTPRRVRPPAATGA